MVAGWRVWKLGRSKVRIIIHIHAEEAVVDAEWMFVNGDPSQRWTRGNHVRHFREFAKIGSAKPSVITLVHATPGIHRDAADARNTSPAARRI